MPVNQDTSERETEGFDNYTKKAGLRQECLIVTLVKMQIPGSKTGSSESRQCFT